MSKTPEQQLHEDAVESVEGWFMDDGYRDDKGFWQMGEEIIAQLLEAEGIGLHRIAPPSDS